LLAAPLALANQARGSISAIHVAPARRRSVARREAGQSEDPVKHQTIAIIPAGIARARLDKKFSACIKATILRIMKSNNEYIQLKSDS
jgi:hypothetical protein